MHDFQRKGFFLPCHLCPVGYALLLLSMDWVMMSFCCFLLSLCAILQSAIFTPTVLTAKPQWSHAKSVQNHFPKDGLCNIDSLCNAIYSLKSFLGIKSTTTLFTDLRGNELRLTFGQFKQCKINLSHINTRFQWHCNQTWNITSRRQHANVPVL